MWRIMKLSMKFAKALKICAIVGISVFAVSIGAKYSSALSDDEYKIYSDANIYFYSNDCVGGGGSGSICGSTAKEKYWTALSKYVNDPIKVAGIMGNLAAEGNFQPVLWEYTITNSDGTLTSSWDYIYGGGLDGQKGVGAFGITSGLSTYLKNINDKAPDLIKYFQNSTEYSLGATHPGVGIDDEHPTWGDVLLEKIGADYDRLVELEVEYAIESFNPSVTQEYLGTNFANPSEAAYWWMDQWERPGRRNPEDREKAAEQAYDELKNFQCSGSSTSASASSGSLGVSSVPGSDITWIGDSDSALAHDESGYGLIERTFPGVDYGQSFNQNGSYIQSGKFIDQDVGGNISGLNLLEDIIKRNELRPYLVFALGGNGGWTESDMQKFLNLINGQDVKAIIATTKYRTVDYPEGNTIARNTADNEPNVYLADVAANYKDEYIDDSGIEFTADGSKMFVQTIQDALNEASGSGSCTTFTGDFPDYRQCDPRWADLPYSNGNFCDSACGATAMAMIATKASGQDVLPTDVANLLGTLDYPNNPGTAMEPLNKKVCEKYGCEVDMVPYTPGEAGLVDKLRKSLEDGWMILTSGGCNDGGGQNGHGPTCPFSSTGHYVAIFGLKDKDTAIVGDPGWDGLTEYKLTDIAAGLKASAYSVIRGSGSKGSACANYCKDNGGGAINGGLTEEQAQKLVDYYNSDAVDGSNLPSGKMNCVSFVKWFIEEFTDLTYAGGNGKDVAHNLATANNLEEGNEPRPFSIFSVTTIGTTLCGDFKCGHTGVVVAVDGDMITTAEAAFEHYDGTVFTANKSDFGNAEYGETYTYIDSAIDKEKLSKIIGK